MIGIGKSIAHASIAVDYARLKDTGEEIGRHHLAGETGPEIAKEFRMCQDLNARCEKNTLQFIVSPTIEEGKKLSNKDLAGIYKDFIKHLGLEDNQSVAFAHRDKKHTHIHIYANRINFQGKAFDDAFISNRSARIAEVIAQARGMTTAKEVQTMNLESSKTVREEILQRHNIAMQHKPKDLNDYILLMKGNKVDVELVTSKTGKVSGLRMNFQGNAFKASEIDRKLSYGNLCTLIAENANLGIKIASKLSKGLNQSMH